jgi:hypothetical protein
VHDVPVEELDLYLSRYLIRYQDYGFHWVARANFNIRERSHSLTENVDPLRNEFALAQLRVHRDQKRLFYGQSRMSPQPQPNIFRFVTHNRMIGNNPLKVSCMTKALPFRLRLYLFGTAYS